MEMFRRGVLMAFGAITALALSAVVIVGGMFVYQYLNIDHDRVALVENIKTACRNGRGEYRAPPGDMNPIAQLSFIERQRAGIGECGEAKMRLLAYDAGIDLSDS